MPSSFINKLGTFSYSIVITYHHIFRWFSYHLLSNILHIVLCHTSYNKWWFGIWFKLLQQTLRKLLCTNNREKKPVCNLTIDHNVEISEISIFLIKFPLTPELHSLPKKTEEKNRKKTIVQTSKYTWINSQLKIIAFALYHDAAKNKIYRMNSIFFILSILFVGKKVWRCQYDKAYWNCMGISARYCLQVSVVVMKKNVNKDDKI